LTTYKLGLNHILVLFGGPPKDLLFHFLVEASFIFLQPGLGASLPPVQTGRSCLVGAFLLFQLVSDLWFYFPSSSRNNVYLLSY